MHQVFPTSHIPKSIHASEPAASKSALKVLLPEWIRLHSRNHQIQFYPVGFASRSQMNHNKTVNVERGI